MNLARQKGLHFVAGAVAILAAFGGGWRQGCSRAIRRRERMDSGQTSLLEA
jgi:hypothetical protein